MPLWELFPLLTAVGIVNAVNAFWYADSYIFVGVEASVGAPDSRGTRHQLVVTGEAWAGE